MPQYKINIVTNKYLFLDIDGVLNSFDDYKVSGKEFLENIENTTFN
jgi:histidinol phosphatase-like enzyme